MADPVEGDNVGNRIDGVLVGTFLTPAILRVRRQGAQDA